jgi:hypothetical protein
MADDLYFGDASLNRRLYVAHATVTAPVIYSTAAGTGGPLLWNGSVNVIARIVAVGFGTKTASTVAGALGFTGAAGQTAAPSSTTAIEDTGNLYVGGKVSSCTPYRIGTTTNAGTFFMPFAQVTTGALTVSDNTMNWLRLDRMISVPPAGWVSVAGSATLTTGVFEIGLVWEEVLIPIAT